MAILVAVSGTHGSGKSTVITEIQRQSNYKVDSFKASRAVQEQLEIESLEDVVNVPAHMMEFQDAILEQKWKNDGALTHQAPLDEIILVERSFLDILVYTELWMSKIKKQSDLQKKWFKTYKQKCLDFQRIYNGLILVYAHQDIPFEVDPNRAGLDTREAFEVKLVEYANLYGNAIVRPASKNFYAKLDLLSSSLEDRTAESITFLNDLHH
jgi:predicted ATPase